MFTKFGERVNFDNDDGLYPKDNFAIKFGSCRLLYNSHCFYDYTHNTKEIIQMMKWLKMSTDELKNIYRNYFILTNRYYNNAIHFAKNINRIKQYLNHCDTVLIEISSVKSYEYEGVELGYFEAGINEACKFMKNDDALDMNISEKEESDILENVNYRAIGEKELILDLLQITKLFHDKIVVFVPHVNVDIDTDTDVNINKGKKIKNRDMICRAMKIVVKNTTSRVKYFNPIDHVGTNPENIFVRNDAGKLDFVHYNEESKSIIKKHLYKYIDQL